MLPLNLRLEHYMFLLALSKDSHYFYSESAQLLEHGGGVWIAEGQVKHLDLYKIMLIADGTLRIRAALTRLIATSSQTVAETLVSDTYDGAHELT